MALLAGKLSVADAVRANAEAENLSVNAKNTLIKAENLLPGNKKELLPLVVSEEEQKNTITVLTKMGFTNGEQANYFAAEINSNPALKKLFSGFEKDFVNGTKYDAALASMGKQILADGEKIGFDANKAKASGTGIVDKLSADLSGAQGTKFTNEFRADPAAFAKKLDSYASGQLTMADMLKEQSPSMGAPAAAAASTPAPASPITTAATPKVAAKAAPGVRAPEPVVPVVAPVIAAQVPSAAPSPKPAESDAAATALAGVLASTDDEISKKLDDSDTALITSGIADKAESLGVNSSTVNGFKKATQEPGLQKQITQNLKNNPDFVRSIAKMAQDKSAMSPSMQQKAQQEMNALMANPSLLADDKYVKGMQQKLKMASTLESLGLDKMLAGFMPSLGPMKSGFEDSKFAFTSFFGRHQVISMGSDGGTFPSLRLNLEARMQNEQDARTLGHLNPYDMRAFSPAGADGKYWHEVVSKNAKGEDVKTKVPNGQITLQTADGKDVKVVPAVGSVQAVQEPGRYVNGQYVAGNVRVPVVTGTNENGESSQLAIISMKPDDFAKYKAIADGLGQKSDNNYKTLAYVPYVDKAPDTHVANVNPMTGQVSKIPGRVFTDVNNMPQVTAFSDRDGELRRDLSNV